MARKYLRYALPFLYDLFIERTHDGNYHVWECKIVKRNLSRDEAYANAYKMIEEVERE